MGKVTSLYGKTTGKIGSIVFSTSGGETIAREYNPHVANPNTTAQVNQRARMKLMSQLSTALAPIIAMTKEGLVSKRNKFVKRNFINSQALNGTAQVSYENIQLTEGSLGLPQILGGLVDMGEGDTEWQFYLASAPAANIKRVVWIAFLKTQEGRLQLITSEIVSDSNGKPFLWRPNWTPDQWIGYEVIVYAYGMADTSEKATANYGNLQVSNASDLARLVGSRTISFEDYQFSQTRGTTIGTNGAPITPEQAGYARVFVTPLGTGGSVSGGGSFEIGSQVTVTATPNSGYTFSRWIYNGTNLTASTSAKYTFTLNEQTDLVAVFEGDGNESL